MTATIAPGSAWTDAHLFNGDFYEHHIQPPKHAEDVADALRLSMGAQQVTRPDYQLGNGCLVDQLVASALRTSAASGTSFGRPTSAGR